MASVLAVVASACCGIGGIGGSSVPPLVVAVAVASVLAVVVATIGLLELDSSLLELDSSLLELDIWGKYAVSMLDNLSFLRWQRTWLRRYVVR